MVPDWTANPHIYPEVVEEEFLSPLATPRLSTPRVAGAVGHEDSGGSFASVVGDGGGSFVSPVEGSFVSPSPVAGGDGPGAVPPPTGNKSESPANKRVPSLLDTDDGLHVLEQLIYTAMCGQNDATLGVRRSVSERRATWAVGGGAGAHEDDDAVSVSRAHSDQQPGSRQERIRRTLTTAADGHDFGEDGRHFRGRAGTICPSGNDRDRPSLERSLSNQHRVAAAAHLRFSAPPRPLPTADGSLSFGDNRNMAPPMQSAPGALGTDPGLSAREPPVCDTLPHCPFATQCTMCLPEQDGPSFAYVPTTESLSGATAIDAFEKKIETGEWKLQHPVLVVFQSIKELQKFRRYWSTNLKKFHKVLKHGAFLRSAPAVKEQVRLVEVIILSKCGQQPRNK